MDSQAVLLDARGEARFRGEQEPVDPVAGHIPGALCRPTPGNLEANGRFKDRMSLMRELRRTLPDDSAVIAYCGSGISACREYPGLRDRGTAAAASVRRLLE